MKKKKKEIEFCGVRSLEYGTYGFPCIKLKWHSGDHECLDKDDCPHHWKNSRNESAQKGTQN